MAISTAVVAAIAASVAAVAATASTAIGVAGAVEQHRQAKDQAKVQEENAKLQVAQMEYNKRMEEREAAAMEAEGAENARRMREAAEEARAQRIAMLGKSGAAMTSGSPLAILGAAAADEEMQIQDRHYNSARQAGQNYAKAADYGYGAAIGRQNILAARASRPSGTSLGLNIAGSVLSTASNYDKYAPAGKAVASGVQSVMSGIRKFVI